MRTKYPWVVVGVLAAALSLTACGGGDDDTTPPPATPATSIAAAPPASVPAEPPSGTVPDTTIEVNGKTWTCEFVIGLPAPDTCGDQTQAAFNLYKGNLDDYVNSGRLGEKFNYPNSRFEIAAYVGLMSCVFPTTDAFMAHMATQPDMTAYTAEDFKPARTEAYLGLCTTGGRKSLGDRVLP